MKTLLQIKKSHTIRNAAKQAFQFNRKTGAICTGLPLTFYLLRFINGHPHNVSMVRLIPSHSLFFIRLNCSTHLCIDERGKAMSIKPLRFLSLLALCFASTSCICINVCLQPLAENEIARREIKQQTKKGVLWLIPKILKDKKMSLKLEKQTRNNHLKETKCLDK